MIFTPPQLAALTTLFRSGAADASIALSRWLGRSAGVSVEGVRQLDLSEATELLGGDQPIAACVMALRGSLSGQLILAFDDVSGLNLADLLLGQPSGTARAWGEVERSAALETANIVGCAYLNALSRHVRESSRQELLPSPPLFRQDFAQSLLETALMGQALTADAVLLTQTEFRVEDSPVRWNLLFVPDASGLPVLQHMLDLGEKGPPCP